MVISRVIKFFDNFWISQFTLNERCPNLYGLHFWRKNKNWIRNGRSRGWAVYGAGWPDQMIWLDQPAPETAQPLDLPFLIQFSFFLQKCSPHMLGHLSLSVNHKLKKLNHSKKYSSLNFILKNFFTLLCLHWVLNFTNYCGKIQKEFCTFLNTVIWLITWMIEFIDL